MSVESITGGVEAPAILASKKKQGPTATPARTLPSKAWFEFYPVYDTKKQWAVRCLLGDGEVEPKGGSAGWEAVQRPYLPPLVVWRGPKEPYSLTIPLLLDGFEENEDVEPLVKNIELMAGLYAADDIPKVGGQFSLDEPPKLCIDGGGAIEHDVTVDPNFEWVIATEPTWGEKIRTPDGTLVRQAVTVTFTLYTPWPLEPPKGHEGQPTKRANGDDTFEQLAAKRWRHHPHWGTKLANLNGYGYAVRKPLRGELVFYPTKKEEKEWERGSKQRPKPAKG